MAAGKGDENMTLEGILVEPLAPNYQINTDYLKEVLDTNHVQYNSGLTYITLVTETGAVLEQVYNTKPHNVPTPSQAAIPLFMADLEGVMSYLSQINEDRLVLFVQKEGSVNPFYGPFEAACKTANKDFKLVYDAPLKVQKTQ